MTLFWHGLFTSGIREVQGRSTGWSIRTALFHREAIGNYKRLTHDIIHDPAMLKYLNNDENLKGHPNENLARELMELFTMGEGNGYTEKDIPEVARALTGMTGRFRENLSGPTRRIRGPCLSRYARRRPEDHLRQDRQLHARRCGGADLRSAGAAEYLAKRLWQFFGTPKPSEDEIAPVAAALQNSTGMWPCASRAVQQPRLLWRSLEARRDQEPGRIGSRHAASAGRAVAAAMLARAGHAAAGRRIVPAAQRQGLAGRGTLDHFERRSTCATTWQPRWPTAGSGEFRSIWWRRQSRQCEARDPHAASRGEVGRPIQLRLRPQELVKGKKGDAAARGPSGTDRRRSARSRPTRSGRRWPSCRRCRRRIRWLCRRSCSRISERNRRRSSSSMPRLHASCSSRLPRTRSDADRDARRSANETGRIRKRRTRATDDRPALSTPEYQVE